MNHLEFLKTHKIIAICRKIYGDQLMELASALYDGGIRLIEVTFDQSDPQGNHKAVDALHMLNDRFGKEMLVGAGTVLSSAQVALAEQAGAKYIVSPGTDPDVIRMTKDCGLLSIPAAMTPSEIMTAHHLGADMIKIFPAGFLGTGYMKDVKAPLSHISFLAAAGINEENIQSFAAAGYSAFGISGRLTDAAVLARGDYAEITARAKTFCAALSL